MLQSKQWLCCSCQEDSERGQWPRWKANAGKRNAISTSQPIARDLGRIQRCLVAPRAAPSSEVSAGTSVRSLEVIKEELMEAVKGTDMGIFGVPSGKKDHIERLIAELEEHNPTDSPTENLEKVAGEWTLLYSTIKILGSKRTKLGLREFVKLGNFRQIIDVDQSQASNVIDFRVTGLGLLTGSFTIDASFKPVSPTRVEIKFLKSVLVPEQLLLLFQKNYDLLLSVFNPEGWLDITFSDEQLRVGRDDKGNVFVLRR
ncbi:hypothetical protein KFL_009580060 [Klebsormidium nitens]|uniref:Plastid lipid-associated protein/fibrillin conserved domain-containing protein n=1 Tax=Klebsormidium nitens TaxID=105231 RepID=A0A1Y1IVH1_KLENI|nr:hypothetical protein KFL_009580060 [Klebsormidium nitens]|eukprot:GAQ92258.1 hypothetical protein KFL_009580060 [Klebsormidium nitens]